MIFGFKKENSLICSGRLFGKSHSTLKILYTSLESPTKTSPLGTHKRMTLVPVRPLYTSATGKTFSKKPLSILSMKLHVIFHKGPGALLVFLEGRLLPVGLGIELSWLLNGDSFLLEFPYFLECSLVVWVVHRLGRDWVLNVAQS